MKEKDINPENDDYPFPIIDDEGNKHMFIGDSHHDDFIEILKNLDSILGEKYNLELYIGDHGSTDIFIHVKQRS